MNTIKKFTRYTLYLVLVAVLFASCEYDKIPETPFIVYKLESCEGCKAKYKYKVKAMNSPKRTTEFITDEFFQVGDTLRVSK